MPKSKFWEESLRFLGFGKNNVATTNRLRVLCEDKFDNIQELRAMLLAFAGDNIRCDVFFNKDGAPLSFGDVCQQAQYQVTRLRYESRENRGFLRWFFVTLTKWKNLLNLSLAIPSAVALPVSVATPQILAAGSFLVAFAWIDDYFSGKLRNAINKKIKTDIKEWYATVGLTNQLVKDSIHKDIRNACGGGNDSIRDVRLYIMRHHPTLTARVLIHPDGSLLSESEICKALAFYA